MLRGLKGGSWRQEWVAEEIVINLPFRAEDKRKKRAYKSVGDIFCTIMVGR